MRVIKSPMMIRGLLGMVNFYTFIRIINRFLEVDKDESCKN